MAYQPKHEEMSDLWQQSCSHQNETKECCASQIRHINFVTAFRICPFLSGQWPSDWFCFAVADFTAYWGHKLRRSFDNLVTLTAENHVLWEFRNDCQTECKKDQCTERRVDKHSLTSCVWAHFPEGFHTMPGQHSQPAPTLLAQGCTNACTFGTMTGLGPFFFFTESTHKGVN